MNVLLRQIEPCQVADEWTCVEHLLNCAPEYWNEHYELEQIRQMLQTGKLQFWYLQRESEEMPYLGAMTQIEVYGLKKVLNFVWLGGESFDEVVNFLWVAELWAKKFGCSEIGVTGRAAFERVLREKGFVRTHVVLRKRLDFVSGKIH